jgi:hypothetical protein
MKPGVAALFSQVALLLFVILATSEPGLMGQVQTIGQWTTLPYTMPVNPIHAALLPNGKVLIVAGSGNCPPSQAGCPSGPPYGPSNNSGAALWDPITGSISQFIVSWDMFCNAMVLLPNGRPFINGGTLQYDPFHGSPKSSVFDPSTNAFTDLQDMAHGRWYPTVLTLGDGRLMTVSGLDENGNTNTDVEFYTIGSGWSPPFPGAITPTLYPRMHLLPNGKVFVSGWGVDSTLFDPSTTTWMFVTGTNYANSRTYGTSVLLPLTPANNYNPKVIIMGGDNPATKTTETIDLGSSTPQWKWGPNMSQPRIEMNAVILPNGRVLAMGGSVNDEDTSTLSLNADLYDPATNAFSSAGANSFQRLYHSVALLLPDATVWLAGGNPARGTYESHMEIYRPAYLFNSDGTLATRPTITSAPNSVSVGTQFTVQTPDAASISSVVLVRNGSVTHAFGMDQRFVGLSFTAGAGALTVTAPPNGNIAPPGYYMLFLLNSSGVPSVASFVQVLNATAADPFYLMQSASGPSSVQSSNSSVAVTYPLSELGGDLNVVVVGWGDTSSSIGSVTDTRGNSYARAVGPTSNTGLQQSIYYAKNIAGGNNMVTVKFNQSAAYPDVRILEYNGASTTNPLDISAAATGSGTLADSGSAITTAANDLIFGAGTTGTAFSAAGSGFTLRMINAFGNIAEDKMASSAGTYNATATTSSSVWVMQMAAFRPKVGSNPAPTVSTVSPTSGTTAGGTPITITGAGFSTGASLTLGDTAASNVNIVSSTSITATTPTHTAGAVNVVVTNADGQIGTFTNGYTYTSSNPSPTVTGISPVSGSASGGTAVTITGTGFLAGASVMLGGAASTNINVVSSTSITAVTAAHTAGAVNVVVTNTDGQSGTLVGGFTYASISGGGINFVQVNSGPSTIQASNSSIAVKYPLAELAGDLNIVVVGWGNTTSSISSVTDTRGNIYTRAVGPTSNTGLQQSVYYAKNILAGSNTVTVKFNQRAAYPDVRILEYSGASTTNPLDSSAAAIGTGTVANSGPATTTAANELIFGAGTTGTAFSAAGSGFVTRIINVFGNIAEDEKVTTVGSYSATAATGSSVWVMQVATFK